MRSMTSCGRARPATSAPAACSAWQFAKAQHVAERNGWTRFVSMQPHYNLLYREEEREMIPLCIDQGVGVIPWSPLAVACSPAIAPVTVRRRRRDQTPTRSATTSTATRRTSTWSSGWPRWRLDAVCSPAQVALAWLLQRTGVTAPIVGSTKPSHLTDALAAEQLTLSAEEVTRLEELYTPHPVLGHF